MAPPILDVRNLHKNFGAVTAASNINVSFSPGETVGIIGANGAGKTTFVNMITGYLKPTRGAILYRSTRDHAHGAARDRAARHLPLVPGQPGVRLALGAREPAHRRGDRQLARPGDAAPAAPAGAARACRADSRALRHRRRSATSWRATCRRARASCSTSRWRSSAGRRCCCSTSRPAASAPRKRPS